MPARSETSTPAALNAGCREPSPGTETIAEPGAGYRLVAEVGEAGAEPVGEGEVMGVDRLDAEFLDQFEGAAQAGEGEQGVGEVEPPCRVGEFGHRAVAAVPRPLGRDPAREHRGQSAEVLGDGEEAAPCGPISHLKETVAVKS